MAAADRACGVTWYVIGAFVLGIGVGWLSLIGIACLIASSLREGATDVAAAFTPVVVPVPPRPVGAADPTWAGPDLDPLQPLRPGEQRHRGGAARINGRAIDRGLRTDGQGHVVRGKAIW
jgi:hypothetical protein